MEVVLYNHACIYPLNQICKLIPASAYIAYYGSVVYIRALQGTDLARALVVSRADENLSG